MRNLLFFITFCSFNILFPQKVMIGDNIEIEFLKSKKAPTLFYTVQEVKVKGEGIKKILVRCKIKSINKESVDVNPFSLLDTVNKIRYRMVEFVGYKSFSVGVPTYQGEEVLKTELLNKRGKPYDNLPNYNPSIKDTFEEYTFEGYQTVECKINFKTRNKPLESVTYYVPITMNKFTADLFFALPDYEEKGVFELFFGKVKIADIKVK